jgi:putative aminopeptidase FrvX
MDAKSMKFLEDLCNSYGPSGFEREPTLLTKRYVTKYVDAVYHDNLGNLFFERAGDKDGPVIMMPGHVDEIGMVITSINSLGYLTFSQLGYWFDQTQLAQRVYVMGKKGLVPGVIAAKPPHVMDAEERRKIVTKDKMFVDVGASNKEEAEAMGIRIGDAVAPDSKFYSITKKAFKDGKPDGERTLFFGKAFDNRISTFLVAEMMRTLKEEKIKHPNRVVGCATVQEEVMSRGAKTAANFVEPDVAIVVDVDIAGDVPGIELQQAAAKMGQGIAITAWDALTIPNQPLKELVIDVCEKNKIPYQLTTSAGGGTDAAEIHKSNVGVPSISIGVPTRHIHSHVSVVDRIDIESSLRCMIELVKALDRKTVDSLTSLD